ncbi:hypothetical protein HMPREF0762_01370 [Slackia exigua ATCC 700122]|uniref:Uncharacterized protein n=1 Tax=Slackia exigua (strain ATCC 700122 / DSM 15923 / CIP 105133 / JCM 11022 / KCTC 5966 / S-7) TaxID=649764 RepID=D0WHQ2_SLAES|nr:hypothetical protein HMPREF0762_01370 [Slackia exigua ATCC 700122]
MPARFASAPSPSTIEHVLESHVSELRICGFMRPQSAFASRK